MQNNTSRKLLGLGIFLLEEIPILEYFGVEYTESDLTECRAWICCCRAWWKATPSPRARTTGTAAAMICIYYSACLCFEIKN